MAESYDVSLKVVSQKGECAAQHKVGGEWIIKEDLKTPEGMCIAVYSAVHPYVMTLMFGGSFPWEAADPYVTKIACPDPANPVIFKLRRRKE